MKTLIMDFNDSLARYLELSPEIGIATRELTFEDNGSAYQLSAIHRDGRYFLALRDEHGYPCSGFEARLAGARHVPEEGEESLSLTHEDMESLAPVVIFVNGRPVCRLHVIPQEPVPLDVEESRAQSEAWNYLYRYRTCPPWPELAKNDERARRHRSFCPSCAELSGPRPGLAAVFADILPLIPVPGRERPAPGQVWSLKQELGGWNEDGEYLHPPLVVLVSSVKESVRAVPCCPANGLALEFDVELGHGLGFAEHWNAINLPARALDRCFLTLDAGVVKGIESRMEAAMPEAASTWRRHMRVLEGRVAAAMRDRAILLAMVQETSPARSLADTLVEKFENIGEALRQTFFPPEHAFARGAERTYTLWSLGGARCERALEITGWIHNDQGLHVSGRLDLPDQATVMTVFATLDVEGGIVEPMSKDVFERFFVMTFPACPRAEPDALRLAAVACGA